MEFTIPQFIEREAKIAGPFTFKQLIYFIVAGGLSIFLYFQLPFWLFAIVALFLLGLAFVLAFVKVGGVDSVPAFTRNLFSFLTKPKVYLWQRRSKMKTVIKKAEPKPRQPAKPEEKSRIQMSEQSQLRSLSTRLETKK